MFLLKPVTLDRAPAFSLQTLVLPNERIDEIGAEEARAVNNDAIAVSAQYAPDRSERPRFARREPKTYLDEMLAHSLFEVISTAKPFVVLSGDF